MVTNYAQHLTAGEVSQGPTAVPMIARALTRAGQLLCGMRGHDQVRHFEGKRVMMRCTSCGHDTPGWEVGDRAPRKRFDGDAQHHLLANRKAVALRKTA